MFHVSPLNVVGKEQRGEFISPPETTRKADKICEMTVFRIGPCSSRCGPLQAGERGAPAVVPLTGGSCGVGEGRQVEPSGCAGERKGVAEAP